MVRIAFVIVQLATVRPQVDLFLFAGALKNEEDR
jgi:hypothetical protein